MSVNKIMWYIWQGWRLGFSKEEFGHDCTYALAKLKGPLHTLDLFYDYARVALIGQLLKAIYYN